MAAKPYYLREPEETLQSLNTTAHGISPQEREDRLKLYGKNLLQEVNKKSEIIKFLEQFKDLMIILLIVSAALAWYLDDTRTMIILLAIVLINALIGYIQEAKAERLLASLKKMVYSQAKVMENGQLKEMQNELLVPGDIVHIGEGDSVPADLRLIKETNVQTNDFSLTGEPNPKRKHTHAMTGEAELGDRTNMLYMGTTVAMGNGVGVVVGTGMNTEIGKIAKMSADTEDELSPLQKEINNIASKLTVGTLILGTALFFIAVSMDWPVKDALLFAVGIAAAMVPQGLPAQISVALASAAGRLAKKLALVKKLSAVETLGSVSVICTDKTGTLTKNEMTVEKVIIGLQQYDVTGTGYEPNGQVMRDQQTPLEVNERERIFFETGVAASNARICKPDEGHATWYTIGDPTEGALITLAEKTGITPHDFNERYPELLEFSFDSVRKRMSSIRQVGQGIYRIYVKGSLQTIMERTTHVLDGAAVRAITDADKKKLTGFDDELASNAMRNLAFAYKDIHVFDAHMTMDQAESKLTLLGLVSMIDPPRETVPYAIAAAREAHIKIVVITGDYALTAKAIATKIGLMQEGMDIPVISGAELRTMPDVAVINLLRDKPSLIFSRTSPEDKVRIVTLCKKLERIVAVTGDGVNDAPALKKADIGVAMGKTGTDVAKDSAEIILLDDSFATLVFAIAEGRVIYQNLKKTILSCISTNGGELFVVLISLALNIFNGRQLAMTAVQILAIDLIGEMAPLAAIGRDPAQPGMMQRASRNIKKHVLNKGTIIDLILTGILMGAFAYGSHWLHYILAGVPMGSNVDTPLFHQEAQTMAYLTILFCQFTNILSRRAGFDSIWSPYFRGNKQLFIAFGISLFLVINLVYTPRIRTYFGFASIHFIDWLIPLSWGLIYLGIKEGMKPRLRRLCQDERETTTSQTLQTV